MSAKLMGQVWDLKIDHNYQLVLLALADHASDDGTSIYPGIEYLVWKTGYSERQIKRILKDLEEAALIICVSHRRGGKGHKTEWQLHLSNGVKKSPFNKIKQCQNVTQKQHPNSDISGNQTVTFPASNSDISGNLHKEVRAHVTIIEPSIEPSSSTADDEKNNSQNENIHIESSMAMAIRNLCGKRTLVLSPKDQKDLEFVLQGLQHENATIEQVQEFAEKVPYHWIGINPKTKKPKPPRVMQVFEYWYEVRELEITDASQQNLSEKQLDALAAQYA